MNRRRFAIALASLAAAVPARALQPPRRVALVSVEGAAGFATRADAFRKAMRGLGWAVDEAVRLELHYANGDVERLGALAQAIAKAAPQVVVSDCSATTLALRNAASGVPIVMAACDDPLLSRFVRAMDKPGVPVTGLMTGVREEMPKPVDWTARLVPKGATVAGIFNPANATYRRFRAGFHYGALQAGLAINYHDALTPTDIDAAFASAARERAAGIVVMADPFFFRERARFAKLAARWRKPIVFPERHFVELGGLMSYGVNLRAHYARAASYVDRILKGADPAGLAVGLPDKFELAVNRKTARGMKIELPDGVLKAADLVIG